MLKEIWNNALVNDVINDFQRIKGKIYGVTTVDTD